MPVILFIVLLHARAFVALSWDVVDPQSNHLGWYLWSLAVTTLSWQWWVAVGLRRYGWVAQAVIVSAMLAMEPWVLGGSYHWTSPAMALVAVLTAWRPWWLVAAIPITALKVFLT